MVNEEASVEDGVGGPVVENLESSQAENELLSYRVSLAHPESGHSARSGLLKPCVSCLRLFVDNGEQIDMPFSQVASLLVTLRPTSTSVASEVFEIAFDEVAASGEACSLLPGLSPRTGDCESTAASPAPDSAAPMPLDEYLEDLPELEKAQDTLLGLHIRRTPPEVDVIAEGIVEEIEVGAVSRERLYRIRYTDGDVEHLTANQVRALQFSPPHSHDAGPHSVESATPAVLADATFRLRVLHPQLGRTAQRWEGVRRARRQRVHDGSAAVQVDEDVELLSEGEASLDPLWKAVISSIQATPTADGQKRCIVGEVDEVGRGLVSGERLYLIRYSDGDVEHLTRLQVLRALDPSDSRFEVVRAPVSGPGRHAGRIAGCRRRSSGSLQRLSELTLAKRRRVNTPAKPEGAKMLTTIGDSIGTAVEPTPQLVLQKADGDSSSLVNLEFSRLPNCDEETVALTKPRPSTMIDVIADLGDFSPVDGDIEIERAQVSSGVALAVDPTAGCVQPGVSVEDVDVVGADLENLDTDLLEQQIIEEEVSVADELKFIAPSDECETSEAPAGPVDDPYIVAIGDDYEVVVGPMAGSALVEAAFPTEADLATPPLEVSANEAMGTVSPASKAVPLEAEEGDASTLTVVELKN